MKTVKVKVPGKIMLAGEYAILFGGPCLAFTIDRFMTITATSMQDRFAINSNIWDRPFLFDRSSAPKDLTDPLIETVWKGCERLGLTGAKVDVTSDLEINYGIGSSSALRLGVIIALYLLKKETPGRADAIEMNELWPLAGFAYQLQLNQQKMASGYDIATQLSGGLVLMTPEKNGVWPYKITTHPYADQIDNIASFWVSGVGASTSRIIKDTMDWLETSHLVDDLMLLNRNLTAQFLKTLAAQEQSESMSQLIKIARDQRTFFEASPHFPHRIFDVMKTVHNYDSKWTLKTTGAGGEDVLLLLGYPQDVTVAKQRLQEIGLKELIIKPTNTGTITETIRS